jgi:hypothetical protein
VRDTKGCDRGITGWPNTPVLIGAPRTAIHSGEPTTHRIAKKRELDGNPALLDFFERFP